MRTQNTPTGAGNTTAAHDEDRLVRLPWMFVQDHNDRMERHEHCEAVKYNSKSVWISLDDPNLDDLLDDARHYANKDGRRGWDESALPYVYAAERLLKAYHDQVVEGDEGEAQ
jgi:hypothetical protein